MQFGAKKPRHLCRVQRLLGNLVASFLQLEQTNSAYQGGFYKARCGTAWDTLRYYEE